MSLLDILKYPLSNPPTLGELEAIPAEILRRANYFTPYMYPTQLHDKLFDTYLRSHSSRVDAREYELTMKQIKKLLLEYNDEYL